MYDILGNMILRLQEVDFFVKYVLVSVHLAKSKIEIIKMGVSELLGPPWLFVAMSRIFIIMATSALKFSR